MNKYSIILTSALALLSSAGAQAAEVIASDFYVNYTIADGWTNVNNARKGNTWAYDRDGMYKTVDGATGGADYTYNSSVAADCWLMSPAVTLKAGETYTMSIWARTKTCDENFKITVAQGTTVALQKAGTVILNKSGYLNNSTTYENFTATFTVPSDGSYNFGVNCYSSSDTDHLYLTRFVVTDNSTTQTEPTTPEEPVDDSLALPFTANFSDTAECGKWTMSKGADATTSTGWKYSQSSWSSNSFEIDEYGKVVDNWLVSPALKFETAGTYRATTTITQTGGLDMVLVKNLDDLTSSDNIVLMSRPKDDDNNDYNATVKTAFKVAEPGKYYIAFHATSANCSYYSHKVSALTVEAFTPKPALVSDLTAQAALDGTLFVNLAWTNPANNETGDALTQSNLTVEVLLDGAVATTLTNEAPGAARTLQIPAATGKHTVAVKVSDANGASDQDPMTVSTGYVGTPSATLPYTLNYYTSGMTDLWSQLNKGDGTDWAATYSYWESEDGTTTTDNYLASPCFTTEATVLKVNYKLHAKGQDYEVGYATNIHDIAGTFVSVIKVTNDTNSGYTAHELVMSVPAGNNAVVIRHTGHSTTYQSYVRLSDFSVAETAILPDVATNLTAKYDSNNDVVNVAWTNPTTDNTGGTLTATLSASVYRDNTLIVTLENLTAGESSSYSDTSFDNAFHCYSVEVNTAGGHSENAAPTVTIWAGHALSPDTYEAQFDKWLVIDGNKDTYIWTVNDDGTVSYDHGYMPNSANDYLVSPAFDFVDGVTYQLSIDTYTAASWSGSAETTTWSLMAGPQADTSSLTDFKAMSSAALPSAPQHDEISLYVGSDAPEGKVAIPEGTRHIALHATKNMYAISAKALSIKQVATGVGNVSVDTDSQPVYYDLHGVRVDNPQGGFFIERRGSHATKVYIPKR